MKPGYSPHPEYRRPECTTSSPSQTHKMLAMLDSRVAGVESTIATALGRISDILSQMCEKKHHFGVDGELRRSGHVVDMRMSPGAVCTATPTNSALRGTEQKDVGGVADVRSHSKGEKESVPVTARPRDASVAAARKMPADDDSYSAEHSRRCARSSPTGEPPAKRVSRVPRMRAQPPQGNLAVARTPQSREKAARSDSTDATPTPPRYRDPTGYENVTDFGMTSPTKVTVPILQPRRHAVSPIAPQPFMLSCSFLRSMFV